MNDRARELELVVRGFLLAERTREQATNTKDSAQRAQLWSQYRELRRNSLARAHQLVGAQP